MRKLSIFFPILILFLFSVNLEARKKKYPNGDYYEGKWKKGAPHGKGIMKYANGDTYVGNWVHGKYSGEGEKTYRSGEIRKYTGNWENSLQHGYGTMHFYNGNIYKGQFNMSKISGEGEMTYRNDDIYTGTWNNGLRSGNGKLVCKNGNLYEGTWKNDAFYQGKATIDNIIYEGEFSDGYIVKGKQTGPNNSWYEGEWKDQVFYTGKCLISNKYNSFEGEVESGYIFKGRKTYVDGSWYEGTWNNEKFIEGKCLITNENNRFEGEVKNGIYYNGRGKYIANNNYYEGKWNNGNFTGYCDIKNNNNFNHFKGNIMEDSSICGTIEYTSGEIYTGNLTPEYIPNGNGTFKYTNNHGGIEINGYWKDGILIKLTEGSIIVEPIAVYNSEISKKQILPLNMKGEMLMFNNISIPNQYDKVSSVAENIINLTIEALKEKYISSCLKTYRVENYNLCKWDRQSQGIDFVYKFDDAEYQINPFSGKYHGKFHIWNGKHIFGFNIYSVQGKFVDGKKEGTWVYERKDPNGLLTDRLVVNYVDGLKSGLSTLETRDENGSRTLIKAYYDKDHWNKKGTSYYCDIYEVRKVRVPFFSYIETNINIQKRIFTLDGDGKLHGKVFLKDNDIELKGEFNHGTLINIEKRNVKKNVKLTPMNGEQEFKELWNLKLPAAYSMTDAPDSGYSNDPFIGLTLIDLTAVGKDFKDSSREDKEATNY